jgi:hypothetical protein
MSAQAAQTNAVNGPTASIRLGLPGRRTPWDNSLSQERFSPEGIAWQR